MARTAQPRTDTRRPWLGPSILTVILIVAALLRFWELGRLSFWYDEVVPIRLARQSSPADLVRLLDQIEATRAPLHPLLLMAWVRLFGPTEAAARSLSALCGLVTVVLMYRISRSLSNDLPTALWAAWLGALSPLLVLYSREAKMYAWLVLLTCLAWSILISFRRSAPIGKQVAYALVLAALVYSQPLGLFMVAALGLAYLANRADFRLSFRPWLMIQGAAALMVAPWIGRYLDHGPEVTTRQSLKLLLGMPIGFIGGDRWILLGCMALLVLGLIAIRPKGVPWWRRVRIDQPFASKTLLIWFLVPPLLLFGYSQVGHPLFGPARYTLFVGPAYLILVARGLSKMARAALPWGLAKLPIYASVIIALALAVYAGILLEKSVYAPDLKADWRTAAADIRHWTLGPDRTMVIVLSSDPRRNVEVETARYYLNRDARVLPMPGSFEALERLARSPSTVILAVGLREGQPVVAPPDLKRIPYGLKDFPGLRLIWLSAYP